MPECKLTGLQVSFLFLKDRCLCVSMWKHKGSIWLSPSRSKPTLMKTTWTAAVESSYLWLPTMPYQRGNQSKTEVVTDAKQQFLFSQKKREKSYCLRKRGVQGWPSSFLLSCHSPTHADRFIGYNNQSVLYHPALLTAWAAPVIGLYTWNWL